MPEPKNYVERALQRAWDALDRGEPEKALELAQTIDSNAARRWVVEAAAELCLDQLDKARTSLERGEGIGGLDQDADYLWTKGELALRAWSVEDAEGWYSKLIALEESVAVCERLALCADLRGDEREAARRMDQAESLDPEDAPHRPRLSAAQFEHVVEEAIELLPEEFQTALHTAQVRVEPVPRRELIDASDCAETPPDMLGLFSGASALERSNEDGPQVPPTIYLFQRNLERASIDREELVSEIRVTLYHEIGHLLGFDEQGVERMGLG